MSEPAPADTPARVDQEASAIPPPVKVLVVRLVDTKSHFLPRAFRMSAGARLPV
jgi:hypothetical protein